MPSHLPLYQTCLPPPSTNSSRASKSNSNFTTTASSSLNFTSPASNSTTSFASTPATLALQVEPLTTVHLEPSLHLQALCYSLFLLHILPFTGCLSNPFLRFIKPESPLILQVFACPMCAFSPQPGTTLCEPVETQRARLGATQSARFTDGRQAWLHLPPSRCLTRPAWPGQSINQSINKSITQSIKRGQVNQSINQSSLAKSINQSINKLINQSINQSNQAWPGHPL